MKRDSSKVDQRKLQHLENLVDFVERDESIARLKGGARGTWVNNTCKGFDRNCGALV